ncbi:DMT family transporter [Rhodovarius crocodyli]|uniref:DMT family transporter n=1 Tax=Rhodovarius crocodyli TaxID=1979269 RepID=A0A437MEK0_9PROT|nr:DMT family transporter [Rhodovarius crocodyli]RVT96074.1 DMT family transporter [Rhodovarius crocodyli]
MSPTDNIPEARRRAISCVLAAALTYALAAACVKTLDGAIPLAQVVLFRSVFAMPVMLVLLMREGGLGMLRTGNPMGHFWRAIWGLVGMVTVYYGYTRLPLANVTALGFTMPLFLTLLSVPLLGEKVGIRRLSAVLVGFGGVLLMLRPWETLGEDWVASAIVLLGAVGWAMAMISIRRMGESGEPGVTIVSWFAIYCTAMSLVVAIPGWVWPTPTQWLLLAGVGAVSGVAQLFMTAAYRSGDTTVVAPFEYSGIIWTTAMGLIFWGEVPDARDAVGMAVLVACGLYIWHRETRLGLKR